MNDTKEPNYKLAEIDYLSGMKYKDIAFKYGVTINTVKSWKTRYKWSKEKKGVHTKQKNVCTQKKKNTKEEKIFTTEVEQVINNQDLTDKQQLFCLHYIKYFNATKAYQKAYHCDYVVANTNGSRLLAKDSIKEEIKKLKQAKYNKAMLEPEDIFQKYMDIGFSDITDYIIFGKKEIQYIDKKGDEQSAMISYVDIKESDEVDGTILTEVSQGKDGIKVKLADRMKALEWLADHMDLATEEQKVRIESLRARTNKENAEENTVDDWIDSIMEKIPMIEDEGGTE